MSYRTQFRPGEPNYCPGCGRSHWIVGRFSAECAFCSTPVEISKGPRQGFAPSRWSAAA